MVILRLAESIVTRAGTNSLDWVYRGCLFTRGRRYQLLTQGSPSSIYGTGGRALSRLARTL
jgi:hypothetical protein